MEVNPHHDDGELSSDKLGQLSEMAGSVWPQFNIAHDLWAQIDQDTRDDQPSEYTFLRPLENWSPLGLREEAFWETAGARRSPRCPGRSN